METFSTITLLLFKDCWLVNGNNTTDHTADIIGMQLVCATVYQMCIVCMVRNEAVSLFILKMCHTCETVHQPYSAQKCVECYLSVMARAHQGYYSSKYWLVCSHINSIISMIAQSTVLHFCVSRGQYCLSYC